MLLLRSMNLKWLENNSPYPLTNLHRSLIKTNNLEGNSQGLVILLIASIVKILFQVEGVHFLLMEIGGDYNLNRLVPIKLAIFLLLKHLNVFHVLIGVFHASRIKINVLNVHKG